MNQENNSKLINKHFHPRFLTKIEDVIKSFSLTEKVFFWLFVIILAVTSLLLVVNVNQKFLVNVPDNGGVLVEGIIGTPRFINPLIAVSGADRDLTTLIYSGLTKRTSSGQIIPDLAEKYEISEDKLEYRFFIKRDAEFHDGKSVTADDVIFTILKARDPEIESHRRSEWDGVVIEKINDHEILFKLKQPFPNFIDSTTIGILPKHLWENIVTGGFSLSKFNTEPIGSGPYKLDSIQRDATEIPISYELKSFKKYSLGQPYINKINFIFAKNESELIELFNAGKINSMSGIKPETAKNFVGINNILQTSLPRIFGVFFNQNESKALMDNAARQALDLAVPKDEIVANILSNFATVADDSIPPHLTYSESISSAGNIAPTTENSAESAELTNHQSNINSAISILEKAGWTKNENGIYTIEKNDEKIILSVSISTSNVPELVAIAEKIIENWKKIGVDASVKIFDVSDLNQTVIRPRNFEALLFGMVINNYSDLYAFWHSSQRLDPGLNITNYANITTDKLLADLREETDDEKIKKAVLEFNENIKKDHPAIFLYSPDFIYVTKSELMGVDINQIRNSEDRFINVHQWFINKDKIWKIFE